MSEPFRTRDFQPVPAHLRPRRSRAAVRVVVTDGASVLLFRDTDPGLPGTQWWTTPGGGMDPGESEQETAVRELREETGLEVEPSSLVGPVMRRTVVHGYSDQILEQTEAFFVLTTARFDPDDSGYTEDEKLTLTGVRWWPLTELANAGDPVWPGVLPELVALAETPDRWPWAMGTVEESTLPVSARV